MESMMERVEVPQKRKGEGAEGGGLEGEGEGRAKRQHLEVEEQGKELPGARLGNGPKWILHKAVERSRNKRKNNNVPQLGRPATGRYCSYCGRRDQNSAVQSKSPLDLFYAQLFGEREGGGTDSRGGLGKLLFEQAMGCSEGADIVFEFCDGGRPYRGHSCVLRAMSECYEALFSSEMLEKREGVLRVSPGISVESFRGFLEYMYIGECGEACMRADGRQLLVLSEMYDIRGLRRWLLEEGIDAENVATAYELGLVDEGDRTDLVKTCFENAKWMRLDDILEDSLRGVCAEAVLGLARARLKNVTASQPKVDESTLLRSERGRDGVCSNQETLSRGRREALRQGLELIGRWVRANRETEGVVKGQLITKIVALADEHGSAWISEETLRGVRYDDVKKVLGVPATRRISGEFWEHVKHGFEFVQRWLRANGGVDEIERSQVEGLLRTLDLKILPSAYLSDIVEESGLVSCQHLQEIRQARGRSLDVGFGVVKKFGSKGSGAGQFKNLYALAVHGEGAEQRVAGLDSDLKRVLIFNVESGQCVTVVGGIGEDTGRFLEPRGIAFNRGGELFVSDSKKDCIQVFDRDGVYLRQFSKIGNRKFREPAGIAISPQGLLIVADSGRDRVLICEERGGRFVRSIACTRPWAVCSGPDGSVFVGGEGGRYYRSSFFVYNSLGNLMPTKGTRNGHNYLENFRGFACAAGGQLLVSQGLGYQYSCGGCEIKILDNDGFPMQHIRCPSLYNADESLGTLGGGVCLDSSGRIFAACGEKQKGQREDQENGAIVMLS